MPAAPTTVFPQALTAAQPLTDHTATKASRAPPMFAAKMGRRARLSSLARGAWWTAGLIACQKGLCAASAEPFTAARARLARARELAR